MTVKDLNMNEYASYYQSYIDKCGHEELNEGLRYNLNNTNEFLNSIPAGKLDYSYSEGKWTIKEIIQHLIDTERIFTYRALRFSRNDFTKLPGYDENEYALNSNANKREFQDLLDEFNFVRNASLLLFKSFSNEMLMKSGKANNNEISVRAIAFILVGHCTHHYQVIRERYL